MREAIVNRSGAELEAIGFGPLVSTLREARIHDVELLEERGKTCVPQVEVEERIDVDELTGFECVDRADLVAETAAELLAEIGYEVRTLACDRL